MLLPKTMTPNLPKLKGNVMKLDQRFDSVSILCGTNFQGMEAIAMHYCAMLTIPSIVTLLLSLFIVLSFPFQQRKQSDM